LIKTTYALHSPAVSSTGGDVHAVRAVLEESLDGLYRFVRRMGLAPHDADDALQEVALVCLRRAGEIAPEARRSFLFGVAYRVAVRLASRARADHRALTDLGADLADTTPLPDDRILARQRMEALDRALSMLPHDLRAVLVLHEIEEHTAAEIALMLDIPPGTVASRIRRGREAFRRAFERPSLEHEGATP